MLQEKRLGDLLTFQRGFDITKKEQRAGPIPIVSSSGINSFHNVSRVSGPGIVIGRKGTLGTVHYIRKEFWPHDTTLWVREFKEATPEYLRYFLPTLRLEAFDVGASNPTLNRNHLHKLKVKVSPPEDQKKIAAILTAYDDLIEYNRQRIDLLEKMAEEIYREWFVRLRFPGHERTPVHKGVPEGWTRSSVRSIAKLVKRGISPKYSDESSLAVLNQKCIRNGTISFELARSHFTNVPIEKEIKLFDVLINSTGVGTLGRTAIVDFKRKHVTVDSHVTICRANHDQISPLYFAFTIKLMDKIFENLASGSTGQTELSANLIKGLEIFRPPSALQDQFSKLVEPSVLLRRTLYEQIDHLIIARNLLLNRLVSGKLRVDDLDIQKPPSMQDDT